uniref:Nucleoporin_C domain-containing protein n=1 Tax=Nippostrongylus brasiliensis TaxID=27835 RepID=A0A0N4XD81_NIPBR
LDAFCFRRAIGQKLFLEERSLCRTVVDGTFCLDFSRTSILPGTSITIFDQDVLCIVVPTQSTVHRFYARLFYDPTEMADKEVSSIFSQLTEKDFLVDNHTCHQLTTTGHALRASVIHHPDLTRVAYCMTEGQLVVVTMHTNKFDKVEEVTLREYSFMKRLLGEASSGGVADVSGLTVLRRSQRSFDDVFYAIYNDGTLRAWNTDNETLLDYGFMHKNSGCRRLWVLWNSLSTTNDYVLKYSDVDISSKQVGIWRRVVKCSSPDTISENMSTSELKESVFDRDSRPFDIVFRSVQIACRGASRCECAHGDWAALTSHVESYLRSPEFDSAYGPTYFSDSKLSTTDAQGYAEKRFYLSLASSCYELERTSPHGLFLLDLPGAALAGVAQEDRFSIVLIDDNKIADEIESYHGGVMKKIMATALARTARKEEENSTGDDGDVFTEPPHSSTPMRAPAVVKKWSSIMDAFLENATNGIVYEGFDPQSIMFDGSFVKGLIASRLRSVVQQRLNIARSLLAVVNLYVEDRVRFEYNAFDLPGYEVKLARIINTYSLFDTQLSLKLVKDTAQVSLCSWFMGGEGVDMICGAGIEQFREEDSDRPQFNHFVDVVVTAALRVLSPFSLEALLPRALATHEQYAALMNLCATYTDVMPEELRHLVTFYKAIAFSGLEKPVKALQCLQKHRHSEEVIEMARSAINTLPPGHKCTSRIYTILFNHLVNQGSWCDALLSVIQNTDAELKRTTLRELISRMLHAQDWQCIVDLIYGKLEEDVANILLTAARAQKATASPHLFKLVFSFYMKRNDLENAAAAQYEYAFVLRTQAEQTPELLRRRRDALAVASTLLDLLPPADQFLSFPDEASMLEEVDGDEVMESSKEITEDMIDVTMHDVIADELNMVAPKRSTVRRRMFILTAEKLREEWVIANARVALLVTGEVPPCSPKEIVEGLIVVKNYDVAFDVCRHCHIPVSDLLAAVTRESIMIDADPPEIIPLWIQANQRRSEKRGPSDHWCVLRGLLAAAQRLWPVDSRPLMAITRTFLSYNVPIPCWLDAEYMERDARGYLHCLVEYNAISQALKVAVRCVEQETRKVTSVDSSVWLPLTDISELLRIADKRKEEKLYSLLKEKLTTHFSRIGNFEKAAQLSC